MKFTFIKKFGVAFGVAVFATVTLHAASTAGTHVLFAQVAPVPEPSTIVAGALMLIPLGAGIARAYYKNRKK